METKHVADPSLTPPSFHSSSSRTKKRPLRYSSAEVSPSSTQRPRQPPSSQRQRPHTSPQRPQKLTVQKIHDLRLVDGEELVLIEWKGYPMTESTWEPVSTTECPLLLLDFFNTRKTSQVSPTGDPSPPNLIRHHPHYHQYPPPRPTRYAQTQCRSKRRERNAH